MLPKGFVSARRRIASLSVIAAGATVTVLQITSVVAVPVLPVVVCVYTIAELAFAWMFTAKRKQLERLPVEQQTSVEQAWLTFNRVQETLRTLSFDGSAHSSNGAVWLREWFVEDGDPSVPVAHRNPHHDNVADLMAEAFFCSSWQALSEQGLSGEVTSMVEALEQRMDTHFPSGRNPHLSLLQHQPRTLPCYYRPLIMYALIETASWINDNMLRAAGYRRFETADGLIYFTKKMHHQTQVVSCTVSSAQSSSKIKTAAEAVVICQPGSDQSLSSLSFENIEAGSNRQPLHSSMLLTNLSVVPSSRSLLHMNSADSGRSSSRSSFESSSSSSCCSLSASQLELDVSAGSSEELPIVFAHGVGMGLLPYLWFLISLAATDRPVLAFEFKHVSQRWSRHVPSPNTLAVNMMNVMKQHGFNRAAFVGHSFGTAVMSRMMQLFPASVAHLTLLDPVAFNMFLPGLLRNFMYRALGSHGIKGIPKDIMLLGAARELHCSATVCRRMDWASINLYANMVPENCLVVLSGKDELLPAYQLQQWLLDQTPATVMFNPDLSHAAMLLDGKWLDQVLAAILNATSKSTLKAAAIARESKLVSPL